MLRVGAAAIMLMIAAQAHARVHKSSAWANTQFASASHLQESLESRPVAERTRHEYQRVIAAYQRVYSESPTSSKADPSVMASAELMEEMGRQFKDDDVLKAAIAQYEFLRTEYPGSKARFDALFRMGEIYQQDLNDHAKADDIFQEFLQRYPRNALAEEAKKNLATPAEHASLRTTTSPKTKGSTKRAEDKAAQSKDADASDQSGDDSVGVDDNSKPESSKTARVLGIRHWSTPDYTRVAIDLDQDVKYRAQKIEHPDRIFFDLYGTKLDRGLYGKNFDVDDGFLRKIRVAQFAAGRTRVVLDLDELTDYRATLQSNPSRLIVDIHNKRLGNGSDLKQATAKSADESTDKSNSNRADDKKMSAKHDCSTGNDESNPSASCDGSSDAVADDVRPDPLVATTAPKKPAKRVVVGKDGVKKTIVDPDDDDATLAKLDPPDAIPSTKLSSPDSDAATAPAKASSKRTKRKVPTEDLDIREAQPTANGDRSLIRALGLKIGKIVIDPGHGGHDTGTIGPNGLEEKDLVLDVSVRLGKLLASRLGAQVVYTRKDDTFIPLEDRTAIANEEGADLFVSVHANSSHDPDARGVETYYLNFTSSPEALDVAARENAVSEKSIHELQDILKKIALKEKIEESHEFASDVQSALYGGLSAKSPGLRNRGVKKAPFIVLIGANMPSILAEISFVSNPGDERKLKTSEYRQKIAESLYHGISKYVNGLSSVKVASKLDKGEGQ